MFEKMIEKNLKKPAGIIGQIIASKLKSNIPEYIEIAKHLDIVKGMKILEIGHGPGYGINYIHKNYDVLIDGIDFSKLMHEIVQKKTKKFQKKTKLIFGDFKDISIQKEFYDCIFLLNIVYFWDDLRKNIEKTIEIIKQGGSIGISIASPELLMKMKTIKNHVFNFYEIEDLVEILKEKTKVTVFEDKNVKGFFYIITKKIRKNIKNET